MTIKIFVGCAANNEDLESQAVLHYTLEKFATEPLDIEWMMQSRGPENFWHGWNTSTWATPFSGFRWGIPARCGFKGRAAYMDSDMIVRTDIASLFHCDLQSRAGIVAKGERERYCVMVMECERLKPFMIPIEKLKSDPQSHRNQRAAIGKVQGLVQKFEGNWNCCDGEDYKDLNDPAIKCLHYTAIAFQPQLKYALPRLQAQGTGHWFKGEAKPHWRKDVAELFDRTLIEAITAGYKPENYWREPFGDYVAGCQGGAYARTTKPRGLAQAVMGA